MYGRKWTMKDGTKIRISEMTDSHLVNAIQMCRRYAMGFRSWSHGFANMMQGDMASFLADRDADMLDEMGDDELAAYMCGEKYEWLTEEAYKRGVMPECPSSP